MSSNYYQEGHPEEHGHHHRHGLHGVQSTQAAYGDREGFAREDFATDEEFDKMVAGGSFGSKKPSTVIGPEDYEDQPASHRHPKPSGMIGPDDYGESDPNASPLRYSNRGQQNHRLPQDNTEYLAPGSIRRYDPSPFPPGAQDSSRPYEYAGGNTNEEPNSFSRLMSGQSISSYKPPSGPPPGYGNTGPAYGYGTPGIYGTGHGEGYGGRSGAEGNGAEEYGGGRPPQGQPHKYSHLPAMAAAHDEYTDPALYHQAAAQLHHSTAQKPQHPAPASSEDQYKSHFAAHAQAYGTDSDQLNTPMDTDTIGAAAAIQALKMSAAQNQSSSQAQTHPATSKPGTAHQTQSKQDPPSSGPPATSSTTPQKPPPTSTEDDEGPAPTAGGGGSQDKIIALAMAQASKLFDKKNGAGGGSGNSDAKVQAMHSAAATAMRLFGEYKSTGKVNLQPGEMQQLMAAATSFL